MKCLVTFIFLFHRDQYKTIIVITPLFNSSCRDHAWVYSPTRAESRLEYPLGDSVMEFRSPRTFPSTRFFFTCSCSIRFLIITLPESLKIVAVSGSNSSCVGFMCSPFFFFLEQKRRRYQLISCRSPTNCMEKVPSKSCRRLHETASH